MVLFSHDYLRRNFVENDKLSPGLEKALKTMSKSQLARIAGVTPQSVYDWCKKGVVPPRSAKKIEKVLGIKRKDLNPEIFN